MRRMASSVLVFEAFICPVLRACRGQAAPVRRLGSSRSCSAASCVLLSGMMRFQWAYTAGWALAGRLHRGGFLVTDMFFLGAVFAAIWWGAGLQLRREG